MTRGAIVALAVVASSCASPLIKLPKLPAPARAEPAADATEVLEEATRSCAGVRTLTAEVAVSGRVGGERVRVHLIFGVERPASARIEATAPFGAPFFIFATAGGNATLLLPRDNRVLQRGRPERVLEAAAGVPLDADQLRAVLTGCPPDGEHGVMIAAGNDWRVLRTMRGNGSDELYFHRDKSSASWQLASALESRLDEAEVAGQTRWRAAWRADFRDRANGLPRSIRLASVDRAGRTGEAFDLTLALSQVETNAAIDAAAFRIEVPPAARPITIEELRRARPGPRED